MRVAALFSGGKDSTYAIFKANQLHHTVVCLVTAVPQSEESMLLHYPNAKWTKLQSRSMKIPQKIVPVEGNTVDIESSYLQEALKTAKDEFKIEGIVHGGIQSLFQKKHFERVCNAIGLNVLTPIWNKDAKQYMSELLNLNFRFIITSVSSAGLDDSWLGLEVTDKNIAELERLSQKHGFNFNFEGGEAETFVIGCPLFSSPIEILKGKKIWDGYRGRFEIEEAELKQ